MLVFGLVLVLINQYSDSYSYSCNNQVLGLGLVLTHITSTRTCTRTRKSGTRPSPVYYCVLYVPPSWYFPCSRKSVIFPSRLTSPLWRWVPFAVGYTEMPLSRTRVWLVMYIPPNNAMATMIHMKPQLPYRDIFTLPGHCNKPYWRVFEHFPTAQKITSMA